MLPVAGGAAGPSLAGLQAGLFREAGGRGVPVSKVWVPGQARVCGWCWGRPRLLSSSPNSIREVPPSLPFSFTPAFCPRPPWWPRQICSHLRSRPGPQLLASTWDALLNLLRRPRPGEAAAWTGQGFDPSETSCSSGMRGVLPRSQSCSLEPRKHQTLSCVLRAGGSGPGPSGRLPRRKEAALLLSTEGPGGARGGRRLPGRVVVRARARRLGGQHAGKTLSRFPCWIMEGRSGGTGRA